MDTGNISLTLSSDVSDLNLNKLLVKRQNENSSPETVGNLVPSSHKDHEDIA